MEEEQQIKETYVELEVADEKISSPIVEILDFSPYKSLEAIGEYLEGNMNTLASVKFYGHLGSYKKQILEHEIDNLRLVT